MTPQSITFSGNAALAPLPPGTMMRYAAWTPTEFKPIPGSAMERVAKRLRQIAPGPEGALVGMYKQGPLKSIWIDNYRAPDDVPARADEVERWTTGVYGWHPKTGAFPLTEPVELESLPAGQIREFVQAYRDYDKPTVRDRRRVAQNRFKDERKANPDVPRRKRHKKAKPTSIAHYADGPEIVDEEKARIKKARATTNSIAKHGRIREKHRLQLENGQQTPGGIIAGDRLPAMGEKLAMRSVLSPSLMMVPYNMKRNIKQLRGGNAKDEARFFESKMLAGNAAYVHLMTHLVGYVVEELDGYFASIGHLMAAIAEKLPDPLSWPNNVTCQIKDGILCKPHLIWWQAPYQPGSRKSARVLNMPHHPDAKKAPIGLLKRVRNGICDRLIEIGADPFYAHGGRTKNPLHVTNATFCVHDNWQSLDWWKKATRPVMDADGKPVLNDAGEPVVEPLIDMNVKFQSMVERSVEAGFKNNIGSEKPWKALEPVVVEFMQSMQRTRNPAFVDAWKNRSGYGYWMREQIRNKALAALNCTTTPAFEKLLLRRCKHAGIIWRFDPTGENASKRARRGRDKRAIDNADVLHAARMIVDPEGATDLAREISGRETSRIRREATAARVAVEIAKLHEKGITTQAAVIKSLVERRIIGRSQAYPVYDRVITERVPEILGRWQRAAASAAEQLAAFNRAIAEARNARLAAIVDAPLPSFREVRSGAYDKKQYICHSTEPVRTIDLTSSQPSNPPVLTIDLPAEHPICPPDSPAKLPDDPWSDGPRSNASGHRFSTSANTTERPDRLREAFVHPGSNTRH